MKRFFGLMASVFLTTQAFVTAATYSEAVTAGDFLYISSQLPVDPATGQIVQGDMETLTNVVIDHIQHLLHQKGLKMNQVVKTEVYLTDIRNYAGMDSAYGQRFHFQYPPARDVIEVSELLYNAPIAISCIAYKNR